MADEVRKPYDKILCGGRFYRYVVACMHNCPNPHYCREFWSFFESKGITPAQYYNEGGIGEKVMRRVVFDCDRCGKKDIGEAFGLYTEAGELPEHRVPEARRADMLAQFGYASPEVVRLTFAVLEDLESVKKWQHYCGKCFQRVTDGVAAILNEPRRLVVKPRDPNDKIEEPGTTPGLDPEPALPDPVDEPSSPGGGAVNEEPPPVEPEPSALPEETVAVVSVVQQAEDVVAGDDEAAVASGDGDKPKRGRKPKTRLPLDGGGLF